MIFTLFQPAGVAGALVEEGHPNLAQGVRTRLIPLRGRASFQPASRQLKESAGLQVQSVAFVLYIQPVRGTVRTGWDRLEVEYPQGTVRSYLIRTVVDWSHVPVRGYMRLLVEAV